MNVKELIKLLEINSPSGDESVVADYVTKQLIKEGFKVSRDKIGNVSAVRGKAPKEGYPLLNAHMDIVDISYYNYYTNYLPNSKSNKKSTTDVEYMLDTIGLSALSDLYTCDDCKFNSICETRNGLCEVFFPDAEIEKEIISWYDIIQDEYSTGYESYSDITPISENSDYYVYEDKGNLVGSSTDRVLGGDDKCGIFIALEVARMTKKPMKILFTVQEEVGLIGISEFARINKKFFKDVAYSITIDRKSGDNLLNSQCGVRSASNKFTSAVAQCGIMAGIPVKIMDGSISDVVVIRDLVPESVNISAGYYNPHTGTEYVVIKEVGRIIKWVNNIITEI